MSKILLLTEEPNSQAANLKHGELFDLSKNPISQFFGRVVFAPIEENAV